MKLNAFNINKKLLRIKAHYFLFTGGNAPISPFIPTIAKDLGFSPVNVGWIYTITPITSLFLKPLVGGIADKYRIDKSIFIFFIILTAVSFFSIQWVPPLQKKNQVNLNCNDLSVEVCSDKPSKINIRNHIQNSTRCKIGTKENTLGEWYSSTKLNESSSAFSHRINQVSDFFINKTQGECLYLLPVLKGKLENFCNVDYGNSNIFPVEIDCDNGMPFDCSHGETYAHLKYQFWLLLLMVVGGRVAAGISNSLADTISFQLLGDKPERFGMQKMWAGIAFGIMSFISSLIVDATSRGKDRKDFTVPHYLSASFFIVDLIIVSPLKVPSRATSKNIVGDVTTVLKDSKICLFLVWVFVNGCFISAIISFLFLYVEDLNASQGSGSRGYIKTLEGLISMIQTNCGEVPFFFFSGWILKRVGHSNAMTMIPFAYALRFFLYTQLVNPWLILPIEMLHGFNYGLFYSTMVTYAKIISPPGTECTVQALVSATFEGAGMSVGSLVTGYLVQAVGYSGTFSLLAYAAFIFGMIHLTLANFHRIFIKIEEPASKKNSS